MMDGEQININDGQISVRKDTHTDGTVTSRLDVVIPATGREKIDRFYAGAAERLEAWYDRVFAPYAAKEYDLSDDDRKKWRFNALTLTVRAKTEETPDEKISVTMLISCDKGGGNTVKKARRTVWSANGKRLITTGYHKPSKKSSNR